MARLTIHFLKLFENHIGIVLVNLFIVNEIRPLSDIMTYSTSINITPDSQANTAILLGLLSVFAFSLTLPFSKIAVQVLTGLEVGLLRSLIGGVMAMIILLTEVTHR